MEITPEDVMQVLENIEKGRITLSLVDLDSVRCGWADLEYKASNGWTLVVFEYEYTWDYLDAIIFPDGSKINLRQGEVLNDPKWEGVREYRPPREVIRNVYQIPDDSNEIYRRGVEVSTLMLLDEINSEEGIRRRKTLKKVLKSQIFVHDNGK